MSEVADMIKLNIFNVRFTLLSTRIKEKSNLNTDRIVKVFFRLKLNVVIA